MNLRSSAALAITGLTAVALMGCSTSNPESSNAADEPIQVVATTTQVGDFTRELTKGLNVEVTQLLEPGMSVHSFEATPDDLVTLGAADLVVASGAGLEEWLDPTIEASGYTGTVVDASSSVELSGTNDEEGATGDGHAEAEAEHEGEEGEVHAEQNPHTWTSPANAQQMIADIAANIQTVEGIDAALVQENADAYSAKLDELDAWIADNIATVPEEQRLVVTNHNVLHYYLQEYGITFVGSIMPSFDDSAEPSAAEIDALIAAMEEQDVQAIFTETQLSPQTAETIATETGARVFSGDDALVTDALTEEGTPTATYLGATIHNTELLMDSWGATATATPEALTD